MEKLIPPEWLDEEAKKEFKRVSKILNEDNSSIFLKENDIAILTAYSNACSHFKKCVEEVNRVGDTISKIDRYGHEMLYANPAVKMADTYYQQILKCCAKLGLSPVDRVKAGVDDGGFKDNKFAKLLKDRNKNG